MSSPESLEARVQRLEDKEQILQSLVDYGELLDLRDLDAWVELFADDGEFSMSTDRVAKGHAALKAMMRDVMAASPKPVVHLEINPRITLAGDTATSTMMFGVGEVMEDGKTRVVFFGHHHSTHVRTPRGWKIQRRRNVVDLPKRS